MPTLTELRAQLCAPVPPADAAVLVPLVQLSSGPALLYHYYVLYHHEFLQYS